jgi:hypothetical protein
MYPTKGAVSQKRSKHDSKGRAKSGHDQSLQLGSG